MFTTAGFDSSINLDRRPEIVLKLLTTGFNIDVIEVVLLGTMLPCIGFVIPEVALLPCTGLDEPEVSLLPCTGVELL